MPRSAPLVPLVAELVASGCAAHATRLHAVRTAFHSGNLAEADGLIDRHLDDHPRESDVLRLERAMVALADNRPADAEQLLRTVRENFDHLEQESPAESVWVMATDDDRKACAGEDYEKVLVRAMLAPANLVQDGDAAEAYCLEVSAKQRQIVAAGPFKGRGGRAALHVDSMLAGRFMLGHVEDRTRGLGGRFRHG